MTESTSFDNLNRQRRKSRFDDPNPAKRSGFHDSQGVPQFQQPASINLNTNFRERTAHVFNDNVNNVDKNINLQNGGFHPQFMPPMPAYSPFMPPTPQLLAPVPLHQPYPMPPVNQMAPGIQFPPPQFIQMPQLSSNGVNFNELKDKEDLDSCNVGIMASILLNHKKGADFVPYKPLDNFKDVPNKSLTQPISNVTIVQINRVEDFYDEIDELFQQYKSEIDPNDAKYNYSRRRKFNLNRQLTQPVKIVSQDEIINPIKGDLYASPAPVTDSYMVSGKEGIGMGSNEDLFESFRRKRSSKYHETYAIRESVRKDPNCIVVSTSELCYSCNKVIPTPN